jgi:phosphoribosyl 1,2-cyclic phosphodiesterase
MDIKIWGSRGSFICPEKEFSVYGGNTTCLELIGSKNNRLLIDAGSGLINFGRMIMNNQQNESSVFHLLLTHTHIDHLQGFSFFPPIHLPETMVKIYCAASDISHVEETFNRIFHTNYSPIQKIDNLQAHIQFIEMQEEVSYSINGFNVTPIFVDHPSPTFAYKIEENGDLFGFITDHEVSDNSINSSLKRFFKDIPLVFHDGQYCDKEYEIRKGWGHSTINGAVENGREMGVKSLGIFHHSPDHTDEFLEKIENEFVSKTDDLKIFWVKEGQNIST